ncbi:putative transcription factor gsfR1 [Meristemomyces frigidus]|nr:putative transcription factor gsfR1 [Meristemomyces frigidus]
MLARQMLLFAAAVQQLSTNEVVPGLTEHQHIIIKALAEAAIKLVNMDDALLGTLEGVENFLFEIFYHIDCGNIRRA